jgi:hypothetical protein
MSQDYGRAVFYRLNYWEYQFEFWVEYSRSAKATVRIAKYQNLFEVFMAQDPETRLFNAEALLQNKLEDWHYAMFGEE